MKMKSIYQIALIAFLVFFSSADVKADVSIANIFSDHMVLQRNMKVNVWGFGDVGENVVLTFNDQTLKTKVDEEGRWQVVLKKMKAGGPFEMHIQAKNKITLKNILIGDVWICSGQSNMAWKVKNSKNAESEIANAKFENIRLFSVSKQMSSTPVDDIEDATWQMTSPQSIEDFSAVAYFFGRKLHQELDVPIGLINSSWGGTCVETWTSKTYITRLPNYEDMAKRIDDFNVTERENENKNKLIKIIGEFPTQQLGMTQKWMNPDFDKSEWNTIELPDFWENQSMEDLDGILWFSFDFDLNEEDLDKDANLFLGRIDDNDVTWLNGTKVGETAGKNNYRQYSIDKDILKSGINNISIKVQDFWGKGGFNAGKNDFYLKLGNKTIPLNGKWRYKVDYVRDNFLPSPNEVPSLLYNTMIYPLMPLGIKGVIWYQGESNARRAKEYAFSFPNMINNWREDWGQGDFPFIFVQLANFRQPKEKPGNDNWAELRESQTKTLKLKNTGMAVAIDLGEANDIHPKNKQDVGHRLALAAFKVAYGEKIIHSGPQYKSMKIKDYKAIIEFDHIGSGLKTTDGDDKVHEFEIAGVDKKFYNAYAKIENNKVIVWSDDVQEPVAVRFGWSINPAEFNLYNKEGLPAIPFRTDEWRGLTDGKSFDD
jgi:sialate O-acetylesterase